jgi:ribokinase
MHPLGPEDVDPDFITSCRVLHLDEYQLPAARAAARIARAHGITTVLDAETPGREGLAELLPWIDYLVVPEEFARGFGDDDSLETAMARLQDRGPRVVVVTRGNRGSMVRTGDRCFAQAAFSVPVVDTTGCGDVFHGGFIFGLLQEWPLDVITEFASAVAALKCGQPGGRAGCPSRARVGQFLGRHGSDRTRAVLEAAGKGTSE